MSSPRRFARSTAAAVALSTVAAGAVVVSAGAPASAAPPASAVVCFAYPNGMPYVGPVFAQSSGFRGWRNLPPTRSMNGCTLWTVESGYSYRFLAYAAGFRTVVEGASPWTPLPYPGQYDAGTWIVHESWY